MKNVSPEVLFLVLLLTVSLPQAAATAALFTATSVITDDASCEASKQSEDEDDEDEEGC